MKRKRTHIHLRNLDSGSIEYSREYYRTIENPYFNLQFFKKILQLQSKVDRGICEKCGSILPAHSKKAHCKTCRYLLSKKYRPIVTSARLRAREIRLTYSQNRIWVYQQLGNKCEKCGFDNIKAFEIHHIDVKLKPRNWAKQKRYLFYYWRKSGKIPDKERRNMMLLCSNCHRIYY